ncbi:MAG: hypothetical protein ACHQ4H_04125 [Ktedonobacterales bacterium]
MQDAQAQATSPAARNTARIRLGAASLAVAGVLFVLYPAIRPFSDETSLQGAQAFASTAWLVAHILAMVAFTLVELGLLGLYLALQENVAEGNAFWALVVSLLGIGLTLPFYGGEAFGLHAIGQEAIKEQRAALVGLTDVVRSGPELVMFVVGLLLLAVGAIVAAIAIWRSGVLPRWSGVPFALGFALYIPQFFGTQPIRVAHGVLVAVGCLWIAASMWRRSSQIVRR